MSGFNLKYNITKVLGLSLIRAFEWMIILVQGKTAFFDPSDFPFAKIMEENWEKIREEYIRTHNLEDIPNIQNIFKEMSLVTHGDNWKSYMLMLYSYNFTAHQDKCPETTRLIRQIPGVTAAMFSILAPGKRILAHRGPYKGVLRYHLGVCIPQDPTSCSMVVNGESRHWYEGKSLIFDDSLWHEAINTSGETRVVLFVDFIRPLPFPLNKVNAIIFGLITASPFIQGVLKETEKTEPMRFEREKLNF
jgi:beta-hydroxylase